MHDILPGETEKWQHAEKIILETVRLFNYRELRTPVIEERALFERSIGSESDIISKEMYTFQDRKGRNLALRPEGTASVVRAFNESGMQEARKVSRLYYYGPMFRYDRPQKGRYRQFYQFGVELLGGRSPLYDAEVIEILDTIMKNLETGGHYFGVNTLGCPDCRERYAGKIKSYLLSVSEKLCQDCRTRMERSPLRILDCKNASCKEQTRDIPSIREILCAECSEHFGLLAGCLDRKGIPYKVMDNLVRGLDYYTKTVFEVFRSGDDNAVAAGGRYDTLVSQLGGADTPAVGFAIGMERLITVMESPLPEVPALYLVCMGSGARDAGAGIASGLRMRGITVETDYDDVPLKAAMKMADRAGVKWCAILGDREMERGVVLLKNMSTGVQEEIAAASFITKAVERVKP